jgi:hypothetical protein
LAIDLITERHECSLRVHLFVLADNFVGIPQGQIKIKLTVCNSLKAVCSYIYIPLNNRCAKISLFLVDEQRHTGFNCCQCCDSMADRQSPENKEQ